VARLWCSHRTARPAARWGYRSASLSAARRASSRATAWCFTQTASPRPAPLPETSSVGERLADFISAAVAAGDPVPETVRRLMRHVLHHQADQLQDDASIVVLEWRTGAEHRVPL